MKIKLTPTDSFFFRNHRSLNAGSDSFASGIFPPRPGTVYGALRSAYIHKMSDFNVFNNRSDPDLVKWMGTTTGHGKFALQGICLEDQQDLIFPLPLDHQVVLESTDSSKAKRLVLRHSKDAEHFGSDGSAYRLYGVTDEKSASASGRFVYQSDLIESLTQSRDLIAYSLDKWLISEQKIGIAQNRQTKQSRSGMLYSFETLRFKDQHNFSIVAVAKDSCCPDFSSVKIATLGAQQRPWSLITEHKSFLGASRESIIEAIEQTGIARIILLTPALWKNGVRPGCWNQDKNALVFGDKEYPILASAIGRPLLEGGWDIVRRRPKPRRNAVPAGSVLYVQVASGYAADLVSNVHEKNLSDDLAQEGYGLTIIGCGSLKT